MGRAGLYLSNTDLPMQSKFNIQYRTRKISERTSGNAIIKLKEQGRVRKQLQIRHKGSLFSVIMSSHQCRRKKKGLKNGL